MPTTHSSEKISQALLLVIPYYSRGNFAVIAAILTEPLSAQDCTAALTEPGIHSFRGTEKINKSPPRQCLATIPAPPNTLQSQTLGHLMLWCSPGQARALSPSCDFTFVWKLASSCMAFPRIPKGTSDSAALHRKGNSSSPPAQLLYSLKNPCAGWTRTRAPPECLLMSRSKPDSGMCEQHQGPCSQSISLATFPFGHLLFFKVSAWSFEET